MAPLPVIPNVARVTLRWNHDSGISPRNVWNFNAPTHTEQQISDFIEAHMIGDMFLAVHQNFHIEGCDVIFLDGTSATHSFNWTIQPEGNATGDIIPQVANVVSFHTDVRGPQGRGRMYLGPVGESVVNAGNISFTTLASIRDAWDTFITDTVAADDVLLVVATYTHADAATVRSATVKQLTGTQRRRMDQLR